jgi:hypothetical protein
MAVYQGFELGRNRVALGLRLLCLFNDKENCVHHLTKETFNGKMPTVTVECAFTNKTVDLVTVV